MIGLKSVRIKTILFHVLFWVAVWFFYIYFFSYNSTNRAYILSFSGALLPITIVVTYVMIYRIIPNSLFKKKYFQFTLHFFYTTVFAANAIVIIIYASLFFILKFNVTGIPPMIKNFSFVFILMYLVVGVVSMVYILNNHFVTISRNKELQSKILEARLQLKEQELHYLKKQIHPHFLFNTLNTIYGLALKQSEYTPDVILKLSNLLDYILYQVDKPKVSLKEEVLHIKEYIELEKIRFQDTLRVNFKATEIKEGLTIAPMLLIPFIENAFKHGALEDGFLQIEIAISVTEVQLYFVVKNPYLEGEENQKSGIGLENIRKRLELNYKDNYELNIKKEGKWFVSELTIFNINPNQND